MKEELKKEWEREFDEKFHYGCWEPVTEFDLRSSIKSFISSLLAKQQEVIKAETLSQIKALGAIGDVDLMTVAKIINKLNGTIR